MSASRVTPIQTNTATLIDAAYESPDYRDNFLVDTGHGSRIEDFATGFFLSQPAWLAMVSMNLAPWKSRRDAVGLGDYLEGSAVGAWQVHGRTSNEIMFGDHMGFMEYRFSIVQRDDGRIEASTAVKYLKRFGHIYFAIVKPFHIGFIKVALRNAATYSAPEAQ